MCVGGGRLLGGARCEATVVLAAEDKSPNSLRNKEDWTMQIQSHNK